MWVITKEVNDYRQYGEYFVCCFKQRPTKEQLEKIFKNIQSVDISFMLTGGGRKEWEDERYWLHEVKEGEIF